MSVQPANYTNLEIRVPVPGYRKLKPVPPPKCSAREADGPHIWTFPSVAQKVQQCARCRRLRMTPRDLAL